MFKQISFSKKYQPTLAHPFTDVLCEFEGCYIQKGDVYVPSKKGKSGYFQIENTQFRGPFEQIGKKKEFEKEFYQKNILTSLFDKVKVTHPTSIFFHEVIFEYLTNKPSSKITTLTGEERFIQNSPVPDDTTTIITNQLWAKLNANPNKRTSTFLEKGGEIYAAHSTNSTSQLINAYRDTLYEARNTDSIIPTYLPVFNKKHGKTYFGKNALTKEITISEGDIGQYLIETRCPKSVITKDDETYEFDPVTLKTRVRIRDDELILERYPSAPEGYKHVFVFETGNICYDGDKRFSEIGLTTSQIGRNSIKDGQTVNKLKRVLDEGHLNLLFGNKNAKTYATSLDKLEDKKKRFA